MAQLTENQQERLNNLQYVSGGVALVGSIVGVIYSSRTGGGFWRGVGYWVLGGLVFGIPAALVTMPFKSKQMQKACYATKGFGGKVNCKQWSAITNQKSIPKKVSSKKK